MEQPLKPLSLTKILIHSGFGAYGSFSDEFYQEFIQTYDIDFRSLPSYDPDHNDNEHISSRYDPRLIDIFEKLGKDRCFEKIPERPYRRSSLRIVEIPTMLLDAFYISAYDGAERIWCNISKKYKDVFLDALNRHQTSPVTLSPSKLVVKRLEAPCQNIPDIQHKLDEIAQCETFLTENNIHFV